MQQLPPFFKFLTVLIIWGIAGVISIVQLFFAPAGFFNLIMMAVLFGLALAATGTILNSKEEGGSRGEASNRLNNNSDKSNQGGKRKNEQAGGLSPDMLALLDEDDIADLRRRLKNRLIERIEGGSDGELSSLDALLADQDTTPRKNRR